ncbi:MAG: DegV family protein [Eubacteriales bacterium]|nr:DegV family protein [Eubacteriales bacterium]
MALHIITDCGADLPPEIITKYGVEVISMMVYLDDKEYIDGVDITPKEVYEKMRSGARSRTAQIMPDAFFNIFEKHAKNNDSVIYIGFSSGLSGTFNSANIAKTEILEKYPDFDLSIIDSKCASLGLGLVVYIALQMKENGASKDEIVKAAEYHSTHMEHIFTVDDLEYLYRGGRVSKTSAFVGGLLGIKPVLHVDDAGKLAPIAKVKGRQNALKKTAQILMERCPKLENQLVGISHGDDFEGVESVKNYLKEAAGCENFLVSYVGCTIGAHSGPGTLAIFALDLDSPYIKTFI